MILQVFLDNPLVGIILFASVAFAISVHEAAHAYTAYWLGDDTPKLQKRLTLNPLAHLDKWGTLLIVLFGIGWGRPVIFNPFNLKNLRRDVTLVSLAGPLSNIVMAVIVALMLRFVSFDSALDIIGRNFIYLNVILAVFNMLPIEPLDGFKVVGGILPPHLAYQWEETRRYGMFILIFILITGMVGKIVFPLVNLIVNYIMMLVV
ncbi:site-2 protease family protein [candidate division WWE3 bacterium CG_4_9_14_3_um_filter_34_6]|uniref:Site-2 protease family protein n=1 Tax=candidate division WWE3 bacterium CG_4_9_14_3_um_filter_34_6 TaxID=1975079 RepID=A0A2M7X2F5_UNCKA|nr:MAG: site-2 protease family protein [candidate division WWE3 bacterium CG_4_9_14_3_um_filter_34_6]